MVQTPAITRNLKCHSSKIYLINLRFWISSLFPFAKLINNGNLNFLMLMKSSCLMDYKYSNLQWIFLKRLLQCTCLTNMWVDWKCVHMKCVLQSSQWGLYPRKSTDCDRQHLPQPVWSSVDWHSRGQNYFRLSDIAKIKGSGIMPIYITIVWVWWQHF